MDDAPATGLWVKLSKRLPEPGRSYLVLTYLGTMGVADVAFYEGIRPGGEHWWILSDVVLDPKAIEYWAEIIYPMIEE